MSFVASGGIPGAAKLVNRLKLIVHAVTFGTSRTICMHPPTITHEHMTPEERAAAGIDDGLIRFSVGLENLADLIADLKPGAPGELTGGGTAPPIASEQLIREATFTTFCT